MQMASFVFLIVFSAFSIAMGLAWLSSDARARFRAAGSTIGGLLLICYAAFVAYPELNRPDLSGEVGRLQTQLSKQKQETAEQQKTVASLRVENATLDETLQTSMNAERRRQAVVLDHLRQVDLDRSPARAGSDIVTGTNSGLNRSADNAAAHRAIETEIDDLRQRWTRREHSAPASNGDGQKDLMRLRDRMAGRVDTDSYSVELYPDKEVIRGHPGRYYVVDMKDARSGIRFQFEGGRYTLNRSNAEFRTALSTFVGDIVQKLHGNVRYDLYVRGSADRVPYRGRLEPGFEFDRIRYMKALSPGKYATEFVERRIDPEVRNDDLPHLRAAFLQSVVSDVYPTKPPLILEGNVTTEANSRDRNVELLLFVDW